MLLNQHFDITNDITLADGACIYVDLNNFTAAQKETEILAVKTYQGSTKEACVD